MTSAPSEAANGGRTDQRYRQHLRDIVSGDEGSPGGQIRRVLQLGAERFDVELGLLVRVDAAGRTYTIDGASASRPDLTRGLTGDLLSTYCRMVVAEGAPLVIENTSEWGGAADPAHRTSLLSTYIGTEVCIGGEPYGTVCFLDLEPRAAAFENEDRSFLALLAQTVEELLERRKERAGEEATPPELPVVERRYRTALKHSPVLFAKVDANLRYEWIYNPHPDFDPSAVIGKRDDEIDDGPGVDRLVDLKRRTLERGEQIREEIVYERSDGLKVYDVTATPLREGKDEEVTGLITASLDVTDRKEKERKLEESEARYRALAEHFPRGAVGVYTRDLRYTLVSGTLVGSVLPSSEAFEGNPVAEIFPEKTASDIVPLFRAAVEEGRTDSVDTEFGGRNWTVWATPLRDKDGEIFAGLSFAQDVTEQETRERALRRQRNLLSQAQRLAGAWEVDLHTDAVSWSETVYEIHEVPPGTEIALDDALDFFPPGARSELETAFRRCVDEGGPYDMELRLTTAEGNERWVRTVGAAAETDGGKVVKVAGAFQDITERKEEERRRKQVIRRVTDAIVEVDADWRFTLVNDQAEALYDMREEDLLGKDFWDVFSGALGTRFEETYRQVMQTREPGSLVEYYPGLDGWFDIKAYPNEDGGVAFYFQEVTEQKQREARLRDLSNSIPGVVFQFSVRPDGSYGTQFVSEQAKDMLGVDPESEAFFERCLERIPDPYREPFLASVETAVERTRPWEFEGPFDTPSGERRWLMGRSIPREQAGEVVFNGVVFDITERKEAERALRHNQERLSMALEGGNIGTWDWDLETNEVVFNRQWAEMLGYAQDELDCHFSTWEDLVHPEDLTRAMSVLEEYVKGESDTYDPEIRMRTKSGDWKWIQTIGKVIDRDENGEVTRAAGIHVDIDERKQAEHDLRQSERRFRKIFENAAIGVAIGNEEGRILRANPAFQSMMKYEEQELQHRHFSEIIHPDDVGLDRDLFAELIEGKRDRYQIEKRYVQNDGGVFWARLTVSLLDLNAEAKYIALIEDIDKQKRYEEQLRSAKNEAEEAARLKSVMLANMTHEVRTPLTSMIGFSGILKDRLEGKDAKLARLIHSSAERLDKTTEAALQLSQLEAGSYTLDRETLRLDALARRIGEEFALRAEESGVDLDVEHGDAPVEAYADDTAVRRILSNLLDNALKFTPEGGRVTVRTSVDESGMAVVEVEDTGEGIAEEALPEVFDAFKQESEGLTREYEGAGLGLSIVKKLVEALGGGIEVETEKGEGTLMKVRLPRPSGKEAA